MESRVFKGSGMELPPLPEDDPLPVMAQGGEAELVVHEDAFVAEVIAPRIAFEQSSRGVKKELDNERRVEVRDEPGPVPIASVLQDKPVPQPPQVSTVQPTPQPQSAPPLMPPVETGVYTFPTAQPQLPGGMYKRAIWAGFITALAVSVIFGFVQALL